MNKSLTLITTALLTVGFAAASVAANVPKSTTPVAADFATHKGSRRGRTAAPSATEAPG